MAGTAWVSERSFDAKLRRQDGSYVDGVGKIFVAFSERRSEKPKVAEATTKGSLFVLLWKLFVNRWKQHTVLATLRTYVNPDDSADQDDSSSKAYNKVSSNKRSIVWDDMLLNKYISIHIVSPCVWRKDNQNMITWYPLTKDLTAARKFQMDANGRKFENRVVPWGASRTNVWEKGHWFLNVFDGFCASCPILYLLVVLYSLWQRSQLSRGSFQHMLCYVSQLNQLRTPEPWRIFLHLPRAVVETGWFALERCLERSWSFASSCAAAQLDRLYSWIGWSRLIEDHLWPRFAQPSILWRSSTRGSSSCGRHEVRFAVWKQVLGVAGGAIFEG